MSLISSVAGFRGLPKSLAYGPTKAALTNLAENLYLDLEPLGLGVSVVHPGFVQTPLTAQNDFTMPALITPDQAAQAMLDGWASGSFDIHYPKRFTRCDEAAAAAALPRRISRRCAASPGCEHRDPSLAAPAHRRRPARSAGRIAALFEHLSPRSLARAGHALHRRRALQGPVQRSVRRTAPSPRIFEHMFESLHEPRFVVTQRNRRRRAGLSGVGIPLPFQALRHREPPSDSRRLPPHAQPRRPHTATTATTGTRPKSCTKSCRWWAG